MQDPLDCNTPVVHSPPDQGKDIPLQSSITAAGSRTRPSPSEARRHLFHDWPPSISLSPRPPRENKVTTAFRWLDQHQTPLPTDSLQDNSLSWQLPEFDFYGDTTWPSPHESPSIEKNVVNVTSPSPSHIQPPLLVDGRYSPPHADNLHNRTPIFPTPNSSNHNSCAATSSGGLFPALALPPEGIISPPITNNPRPKHAPRVPPSGGSLSAAAAASALSSASILASALAKACSEGGQVEHSSLPEQRTGSRERESDYLGKASASASLDPEMLPVFPGGLMGTNPAVRGVLLQTSHKLLLEMCRCLQPGAHSRQALDSRGPIGRQKLSDGWTKSTRSTDGGAWRPHVLATELCRGGTREQALKLRALLVEVSRMSDFGRLGSMRVVQKACIYKTRILLQF